jgi:hypothetical protein
MKDNKNILNQKIQKIKVRKLKKDFQAGYILAFSLIIVAITLGVTLSITRVISKELYFSRLIDYSKESYFAADAGLECAQYLDSTFRNSASGETIILNSTSSFSIDGKTEFENNLTNNIFTKSLDNSIGDSTGISPDNTKDIIESDIFCASDGSYNQMFSTFANNEKAVLDNLNAGTPLSSYNVSGDINHATTTFGLVLKDDADNPTSCILINYAKTRSASGLTSNWAITYTGYSSCNILDRNRVSRTIQRFSNN